EFRALNCGTPGTDPGPRWTADYSHHLAWCMGFYGFTAYKGGPKAPWKEEDDARTMEIGRCKLGRTSQPLTVDTGIRALFSKGPSNLFPRNMPKLFPPSDGGPCGMSRPKISDFAKLRPKASDLFLDEPAAAKLSPILKNGNQAAKSSILSISLADAVPHPASGSSATLVLASNSKINSILSMSHGSASAMRGDPCPGDGPKTAATGPASGSASTSPTGSGGYYLVYPDGGPNPAPKKTTAPSGSASTSSTGSGGAYQSSPGKDVPRN